MSGRIHELLRVYHHSRVYQWIDGRAYPEFLGKKVEARDKDRHDRGITTVFSLVIHGDS